MFFHAVGTANSSSAPISMLASSKHLQVISMFGHATAPWGERPPSPEFLLEYLITISVASVLVGFAFEDGD